jgi:hypothetical protein
MYCSAMSNSGYKCQLGHYQIRKATTSQTYATVLQRLAGLFSHAAEAIIEFVVNKIDQLRALNIPN